ITIVTNFFNSISGAALAAIEATEPLLFTTLKTIVEGGGASLPAALLTSMENAVSNYRANSTHYLPDPISLNTLLPELAEVLDYQIGNDFTNSPSSFRTAVQTNIIPSTIEAYVADADYLEKKLRLWDNLFAEVILPKNYKVREALTGYIQILNLFEQIIADDTDLDTEEGFRKKALGTIILPNPVFPLPSVVTPIEENIDEPDNSAEVLRAEALERISNKINAYEEVKLALRIQNEAVAIERRPIIEAAQQSLNLGNCGKYQVFPSFELTAPQDPAFLSAANYNSLSNPTKAVITELNIPNNSVGAEVLYDRIDKAIPLDYDIVYGGQLGGGVQAGGGETVVNIGHNTGTGIYVINSKYCTGNDAPINPCAPFVGGTIPKNSGLFNAVGVGDLLIVKHRLKKYEIGEVAHIENIMARESKGRENRKLNRVEDTTIQETERYSETDSETRTTERLSMERESSLVLEQMDQNQTGSDSGFGVSLTAGYGPVAVTASYTNNNQQSAVSSTAMTDSVKSATAFSKELMEKTRKRVIEKVRFQRTRTTIDEVIDINTHAFNNIDSASHVRGIFHFVDKIYHSQIFNYGQRSFYEFMVPEPAAFHIFSMIKGAGDEKKIPIPDPLESFGLINATSINQWNYIKFAAILGVTDVTPPPPAYIWVNKAYKKEPVSGYNQNDYLYHVDNLDIPEGYETEYFKIMFKNSGPTNGWVQAIVGDYWTWSFWNTTGANFYLTQITGKLPVTFQGDVGFPFAVNLMVRCVRTGETLDRWKLKTYALFVDAYNRKLADYKNQMSALEIQQGVNIQGDNPAKNQSIIREELKRACIEMWTGQKYEAFSAMMDNQPSQGFPQFSNTRAGAEGSFVKFVEHAFEWNNMTFRLYPYFWGRKTTWLRSKTIKDTDPLFEKFLQSGFARVQVPVRPRMAAAVLHFYHTGQIWMGGPPPSTNDPEYIAMAEEIAESEGRMDQDAKPVAGACWEYKVPTNLVMLRQDPQELPDFSSTTLCQTP
ncbi:MAG: hypothetical protein EBS07_11650, partial [Sphingobacteriia bacterium]|nr:hypothetical protein [Sphingobacteriia bacterium]